jgi:hypothetical protein
MTPEKTGKTSLGQAAIMTLAAGEDIFGGWATPAIPQVGIYKLLAKKKADGTIDWAHFVQRPDGQKEKVLRGTVQNPEEFAVVQEAVSTNLQRIFGVTLQAADFDISTVNGQKSTDTRH